MRYGANFNEVFRMSPRMTRKDLRWPAPPLEAWDLTRTTLHMWTQIVGNLISAAPSAGCADADLTTWPTLLLPRACASDLKLPRQHANSSPISRLTAITTSFVFRHIPYT